jgi:hypothetical protein
MSRLRFLRGLYRFGAWCSKTALALAPSSQASQVQTLYWDEAYVRTLDNIRAWVAKGGSA